MSEAALYIRIAELETELAEAKKKLSDKLTQAYAEGWYDGASRGFGPDDDPYLPDSHNPYEKNDAS